LKKINNSGSKANAGDKNIGTLGFALDWQSTVADVLAFVKTEPLSSPCSVDLDTAFAQTGMRNSIGFLGAMDGVKAIHRDVMLFAARIISLVSEIREDHMADFLQLTIFDFGYGDKLRGNVFYRQWNVSPVDSDYIDILEAYLAILCRVDVVGVHWWAVPALQTLSEQLVAAKGHPIHVTVIFPDSYLVWKQRMIDISRVNPGWGGFLEQVANSTTENSAHDATFSLSAYWSTFLSSSVLWSGSNQQQTRRYLPCLRLSLNRRRLIWMATSNRNFDAVKFSRIGDTQRRGMKRLSITGKRIDQFKYDVSDLMVGKSTLRGSGVMYPSVDGLARSIPKGRGKASFSVSNSLEGTIWYLLHPMRQSMRPGYLHGRVFHFVTDGGTTVGCYDGATSDIAVAVVEASGLDLAALRKRDDICFGVHAAQGLSNGRPFDNRNEGGTLFVHGDWVLMKESVGYYRALIKY